MIWYRANRHLQTITKVKIIQDRVKTFVKNIKVNGKEKSVIFEDMTRIVIKDNRGYWTTVDITNNEVAYRKTLKEIKKFCKNSNWIIT